VGFTFTGICCGQNDGFILAGMCSGQNVGFTFAGMCSGLIFFHIAVVRILFSHSLAHVVVKLLFSAWMECVVLKSVSFRMAKKCRVQGRIGRRRRYVVFTRPGADFVFHAFSSRPGLLIVG
jgi:hypothetical protein